MRRIYNFSAGPAILPEPVLEEASRGVLEIGDSGMSILEVSHRGKIYDAIHREAQANLLQVLGLSSDEYATIFMGGGASLQFTMLPMNYLREGQTADYVSTDPEWSVKAIKEAKRYGSVHVAGSSDGTGFDRIPKELSFSEGARYAHITTNNTIAGSQWHALPETGAPLVADMSSDIFCLDRDHGKFSLFYAGAQKNAGPAGVTLIVVRRDFLEEAEKDLPWVLSYRAQVEKESLGNTPPVYGVYIVNLVLKWIQSEGGLAAVEARNREKAGIVYDALDAAGGFYRPVVTEKDDRSLMNVTFRLADDSLDAAFLAEAKKRDLDGLKGHRSVGGFRASIYNAFPVAGCKALAEFLTEFAQKKG